MNVKNRGLAISLSLYKDHDDAQLAALPLAVGHFDWMFIKVPSLNEKPDAKDHQNVQAAVSIAVDAKMQVAIERNVFDRWTDEFSSLSTIYDHAWFVDCVQEVNELAANLTEMFQWKIHSGVDGEPMSQSPQIAIRDNWKPEYGRMADTIDKAVSVAGVVDFVTPCDSHGPETYCWRMQRLGAKKRSRKTYYVVPLHDTNGKPVFLVPHCVPPAGHDHIVHCYQHWVKAPSATTKGVSVETALEFDNFSLAHIQNHQGYPECMMNVFNMRTQEVPEILNKINELHQVP